MFIFIITLESKWSIGSKVATKILGEDTWNYLSCVSQIIYTHPYKQYTKTLPHLERKRETERRRKRKRRRGREEKLRDHQPKPREAISRYH